MLGTITSISATSWLGVWIGLEINLLSFIPLIVNINNLNSSEAALNYFLIQTLTSSVILISVIMFMICINLDFFILNINNKIIINSIIIITLMIKIGAAPFHFWFPNVIENITWNNRLILIIWQKLAPIIIITYLNMRKLLILFAISSTIIGAIGGLNQISIRKLIAFSSINHIGWIIISIIFNEHIWLIYFIIYSFLICSIIFIFNSFQIYYLNQIYSIFINSYLLKFSLLTSILSLGGLPPFTGFIPKWLIIQSLLFININLLTLFLIFTRLITLYYYLKVRFSAFMLNYRTFNWSIKIQFNIINSIIIIILIFTSLTGFFLIINLTLIIN